MVDKGEREDGPSLEMPSLGGLLRRRKGRDDESGTTSREVAPEPTEAVSAASPQAQAVTSDVPPAEVEESRAGTDDDSDESDVAADDSPTTILDDTATTADERPLFADETPVPASSTHVEPVMATEPPGSAAGTRGDRRAAGPRFRLPSISSWAAVTLTGGLLGLLAVAGTYLTMTACEAVRGTSSCGGPGFFLLAAILVVLVVLGGWFLRLWGIGDPMSTSFLAVGLLAVVALLFLVDVIFSPWMLLVVPLVSVATFALSHWVTTAFVEVD